MNIFNTSMRISETWIPWLLLFYLTVFAAIGILVGISLFLKRRQRSKPDAAKPPLPRQHLNHSKQG